MLTKILERITELIDNHLQKGCDRFEPDICDGCKRVQNKIRQSCLSYAKSVVPEERATNF